MVLPAMRSIVRRRAKTRSLSLSVMAGLVPAITSFQRSESKDVDARHKAGHDEPGE